jgi:hypothetical protein
MAKYRASHNNDFPARNAYFMWRDEQISQIDACFRDNGMAVLASGLGGIGKTQIALEYVHRNSEKYDEIWWIKAEKLETMLDTDISTQGAFLGLPERGGDWLVVFDNAREYRDIRPFLPESDAWHILITTPLNILASRRLRLR